MNDLNHPSSVRVEAFWQDCRQYCSSTAWYYLYGETKGFSPEIPSLLLIREQGSIGFAGKIGQVSGAAKRGNVKKS